jgi:hypothetical protein
MIYCTGSNNSPVPDLLYLNPYRYAISPNNIHKNKVVSTYSTCVYFIIIQRINSIEEKQQQQLHI